MAKRFDKSTYPILSWLGRNKCIDDLLVFEAEEPAVLRHLAPMLSRAKDENRKLTDLEQLAVEPFRKEFEVYAGEAKPYLFGKQTVGISLIEQKAYDVLVKDFPAFEPIMDNLCTTRRPTAYYIPSVTAKAIYDTSKTLVKKTKELVVDLPTESGMLLFDSILGIDRHYCSLAYSVSPTHFAGFILLDRASVRTGQENYAIIDWFYADLTSETIGFATAKDVTEGRVDWLMYCFLAVLFIHFFEVEKVVSVQPAANASSYKRETLNGQHYDSKLTYPVNVIDAHWFTTLIVSDPFLTKGHFRKQPYGPGRGQYKVIWINAFMKKGYTRKQKHEAETDVPLEQEQP